MIEDISLLVYREVVNSFLSSTVKQLLHWPGLLFIYACLSLFFKLLIKINEEVLQSLINLIAYLILYNRRYSPRSIMNTCSIIAVTHCAVVEISWGVDVVAWARIVLSTWVLFRRNVAQLRSCVDQWITWMHLIVWSWSVLLTLINLMTTHRMLEVSSCSSMLRIELINWSELIRILHIRMVFSAFIWSFIWKPLRIVLQV